jgi:CheY-like chemotaxis protein
MSAAPVILLVDDNAAILTSTARYLRSRKLEVVCSDGPFGVTALIHQHAPAVIVLDVMMPALSGGTLGGLLRAQDRLAPIIYYSAMQEEQLYRLAQKTRGASYVLKSDGAEMLYQAIRAALDGKR